LAQRLVFIRGGRAINDLLAQPEATEGWWPENVRQLLGSRSLANRNGPDHRARRRVVGQLFSAAALRRYSPLIVALMDEFVAELRAGCPSGVANRHGLSASSPALTGSNWLFPDMQSDPKC
jgi:cytochrome P450